MAKKSVAVRLAEFGAWLLNHVPPFLTGPLATLNYSQCQSAETGFDAYMADAFESWDFDAVEIADFQSQFVFPS